MARIGRTGLGLVGMGICSLGVALAVPALTASAAVPPQPSYDTADVDGSAGEWSGGDFFATLVSDTPPHEARGSASLRYDCETGVLYAYVAAAEGYALQTTDPDEAYLRIGGSGKAVSGSSGDDGAAPDFAWVGQDGDTAAGFEASAEVGEGSYDLRIHAKVPDDSGDGYDTIGARSVDLVIECEEVEGTTTVPETTTPPPTPSTEVPPTPTTEDEPEVVLPETVSAKPIEAAPSFTG